MKHHNTIQWRTPEAAYKITFHTAHRVTSSVDGADVKVTTSPWQLLRCRSEYVHHIGRVICNRFNRILWLTDSIVTLSNGGAHWGRRRLLVALLIRVCRACIALLQTPMSASGLQNNRTGEWPRSCQSKTISADDRRSRWRWLLNAMNIHGKIVRRINNGIIFNKYWIMGGVDVEKRYTVIDFWLWIVLQFQMRRKYYYHKCWISDLGGGT